MDSAEKLISRFYPVLAAGARQSDSPAHHAELLHQLCTADGLLELLDWTRQGLGADPLACMWLGSLRWYRVVTGSYPPGAPQPPRRTVDAQLARLLGEGALTLQPDSAAGSLVALADGQMAYPSAPAQPESQDPQALLRAVPVGLVPYIDEPMRRAWARQTVALTHGHPALLRRAEELAVLVHELATSSAPVSEGTAKVRREITESIQDAPVREILERQLDAAHGPDRSRGRTIPADRGMDAGLLAVIDQLAQQWAEVTRAQ
ncbi:ADP-ribosylglycohydrolase family protein [Nesterenkonia sp. Act20]|uniref:ADP-ribosylglycohydrolase family protein n=1 Tax=Nesterenkonia sp. Act20 TaxID=1483432 RepID=UPI001C447AC0